MRFIATLLFFTSSIAGTGSFVHSAEFYGGKKLTILVGYGPGGAFDLNGRLLANFLSKHVPGRPTVIVQNMPGAGSATMANYLYNAAPRDGTVIGMHSHVLPHFQLIRNTGLKANVREFNYIGRISSINGILFLRSDVGAATIEATRNKTIPIAASGRASSTYIFPTLMNSLFGAGFKTVLGYSGAAKSILAMEQGEVSGLITGWASLRTLRPLWIPQGFAVPLVQFTDRRIAAFPDTPTFKELASSHEEMQIAEFFTASSILGRAFVAPPGVPAEQITTLRDSFNRTVTDPALILTAEKQDLTVDPLRGEEVQDTVKRVIDTQSVLVKKIKKILGYN